jgi:hypothetical protein
MDDFKCSECVRNYEMTDGPFSLVHTASTGPDSGILNDRGRGVVALLIVGSTLALASLAWFVIGLLVN